MKYTHKDNLKYLFIKTYLEPITILDKFENKMYIEQY